MDNTVRALIDLTGISEEDRLTLRNAADQTEQWADEFVKMFYDTLFAYPPTSALFREGERPEREKTIKDWYLQVVRGEFDDQFWSAHQHVGHVHVKRKILNAYMIGMMHNAQTFVLGKCLATYEQEEGLKVFDAFKRVTDIAAGIIAEGYHTPWAVMKIGR